MPVLTPLVSSALAHPWIGSWVIVWVTDPAPEDKDVKAGWTAFAVFLLLVAATVVLLISFVRQLRKVDAAKEAGLYGDPDDADDAGGGDAEESEASGQR